MMNINQDGINLIKSLEGCNLKAYKLKGERNYTIGYGHSDTSIKKDQTITQKEADTLLLNDLKKFEKYVAKNTKFPLNDNQFSALVSYTYNRGYKGFKELMSNSKTVSDLSDNIVKYWGSNKNYKTTLINRRKKEKALFDKPINVSRETLKVPKPVLWRGSKGIEVANLQKCLNHVFNYGLVIDGHFGNNTYNALCNFQLRYMLTVDGVYGKHTYNKMRDLIGGV